MEKTFRKIYRRVAHNGNDDDYELVATIGVDGVELDVMKGATEETDGEIGLVPKPFSSDYGNYLCSDGTYSYPLMAEEKIERLLEKVYPVNSIYVSFDSTDPKDLFGFGTWERFGKGRMLMGVDTSNTNFNTVKKTGGSENVTLEARHLPSHSHSVPNHTHSVPNHVHGINPVTGVLNEAGSHDHSARIKYTSEPGNERREVTSSGSQITNGKNATTESGAHNHQIFFDATSTTSSGSHTTSSSSWGNTGSAGGNSSHSNLQAYITCYFWLRVE